MAEKKHISVRLEQDTRGKLELIAKRRMMASGVAVTLADLIREGLSKFADSEMTEDSPAPAKPAPPAKDQPDMFDLSGDKPEKKATRTYTPEELSELTRQAQELQGQGLSGRKIAVQLGVNQTLVARTLLK